MIPSIFIRPLVRVLAALFAPLSMIFILLLIGGRSAEGAPHLAEIVRVSPEQAIALAVNDFSEIADGWLLSHPHHTAEFTPKGLHFQPRRGGPMWAWQLTFVGAGERRLPDMDIDAVRPVSGQPGVVAYQRGGMVEQYVARKDTIEQQFLIPQPLALDHMDLVIV